MKKDNKALLKYGFTLFVLGYKVDFLKNHLGNMVNRRINKNKPLSDKRLINAKRQYECVLKTWTENEKKFWELKALYRKKH